MSGVEPIVARWLRSMLRTMQSEESRVSLLGKAWRLVVMVPVFGVYLLIARWRLRRGRPIDIVTELCFGSKLRCTPPDLVMMYAHVFGVWEPDITRFIESRLKPGDTFIDVGANVGYYSLLAAQCVGDGGRIVAIEASPRIFQRLRESLALNGLSNEIEPRHVAAASAEGELVIRLGPEHNLGLTTTSVRSRFAAEATVPAKPLHLIVSEADLSSAQLVKIDVEGGEDDVLAGMMRFLELCPEDVEILVEVTPRWWSGDARTVQEVLQPLFDLGFHAYVLPNNYWPWRYLWPNDVRRPQRVRFDLCGPIRRLDLVLSRVDAQQL